MRIGSSWPRRSRRFATVAIAVALFVAACGSSPREIVARGGDLDHVHDLVLDTDATLLVASHMGLYRIEAIDRAVEEAGLSVAAVGSLGFKIKDREWPNT